MILTPTERLTLRGLLKSCSKSEQELVNKVVHEVEVLSGEVAKVREQLELMEIVLLRVAPMDAIPVPPDPPPYIQQI